MNKEEIRDKLDKELKRFYHDMDDTLPPNSIRTAIKTFSLQKGNWRSVLEPRCRLIEKYTGLQLKPEQLEKIFERFLVAKKRGDNNGNRSGDSGFQQAESKSEPENGHEGNTKRTHTKDPYGY